MPWVRSDSAGLSGQLTPLEEPEWTSHDSADGWTLPFSPKVPGSRPGRPTESELVGLWSKRSA